MLLFFTPDVKPKESMRDIDARTWLLFQLGITGGVQPHALTVCSYYINYVSEQVHGDLYAIHALYDVLMKLVLWVLETEDIWCGI